MQNMKTLAPTIVSALQAVEQGCRKIQHDPQFQLNMDEWLFVGQNSCFGCLATATLLQLTNKSGKDIMERTAMDDGTHETSVFDRSLAYEIEIEAVYNPRKLLCQFEKAIDCLRRKDLLPLLRFYGLENHQHANEAVAWLLNSPIETFGDDTTKEDVNHYADFLKEVLIPKLQQWFAEGK